MLSKLMAPESYSAQQRLRYYLYFLSILLGVPKMMFVWYDIKGDDFFARYAYPFLAFYCGWALFALIKQQPRLERVERLTLLVLGLVWASRSLYILYFEAGAYPAQTIQTIYLSFVLFTVLAYLMFDNPTALKLALLMFVISFSSSLSPENIAYYSNSIVEAFQFQAYLAVMIGAVHVLSQVKTELSESKAKASMLERIAFEDSLTGLFNRRRVYTSLQNNLEVAARYNRPLSLILLDIDHFKHINDTYGHDVGDQVLKDFADLLSPLLRKADIFGRWGGEEFLIICHETHLAEAHQLADRLCLAVAEHSFPQGLQVTASFGVLAYEPGLSTEDLLKLADDLLYEAKHAGRNQVKSFLHRQELVTT